VEENKILVLILKHFSKLIEPFFSDPVPTFESRHVDNGTIIQNFINITGIAHFIC